jgi:alpha-tubulin suppressor-like RCC1 family protein
MIIKNANILRNIWIWDSMYITKKGHLYESGFNYFGQLGFRDNKERFVFEKVSENVVAVSCGSLQTMYITQEGHLYVSVYNTRR